MTALSRALPDLTRSALRPDGAQVACPRVEVLMLRGWIALALGAGGCEAVVQERFVVTLPEEIALRYTAQAPGIVRTSSMSVDEGVLLCGEALPQAVEVRGGLGDRMRSGGRRVQSRAHGVD
jgi:hypothetical protein